MPQDIGGDRSIGERIAHHRRNLGLTQEGFAMRLFRSKSWVTKTERGERPLESVRTLVDIARWSISPAPSAFRYATSPANRGFPSQAAPATMPSPRSGER